MPLSGSPVGGRPLTPLELEEAAATVEAWAADLETPDSGAAASGAGDSGAGEGVLAVDRDFSELASRRWFIRMAGEDKAVTTVWLTLRERTLHAETQFMPSPEENIEACYEYLLRSNAGLYGLAFSIGFEDAIYLSGRVPADSLTSSDLDRLVGGALSWTEEHFRTAMSIGFASRYRPRAG